MRNSSITLASVKIGTQLIAVELYESPGDEPATVTITWPRQPLTVSEPHYDDVQATLTRLFTNASLELARLRA